MICEQLRRISEFSKKVRSVYKYGIEVQSDIENIYKALAVTPYIYDSGNMVNMFANSGLLNSFLA